MVNHLSSQAVIISFAVLNVKKKNKEIIKENTIAKTKKVGRKTQIEV